MKSSPAPGLANLGRADMEAFRPGEVPLSTVTTDSLVKTTHTHTYTNSNNNKNKGTGRKLTVIGSVHTCEQISSEKMIE